MLAGRQLDRVASEPRHIVAGEPGQISVALRTAIEALAADSDALVERTLRGIFGEVPEYEVSPAAGLIEDVRAMVRHNVQLWYGALLAGSEPSPEELQPLDEFARDRVYQKIPLEALLRAFRVGGVEFANALLDECRETPEIQAEVLFEILPFSLVHLDIVSHTIGTAYLDELGHQTRRRDRQIDELVRAVFEEDQSTDFDAALSAMGMDPRRRYCALALRPRSKGDHAIIDVERDQDRLLGRTLAQLEIDRREAIHTVCSGSLVIWIPAPAADNGDWERTVKEDVERLLALTAMAEAAGIGATVSGREGWRASSRQAIRAMEIGATITNGPSVHRYFDLALYDVAARTPELADLLRSIHERLAAESELLATLEAYFAHGRHLKAAAAELGIHPNTLSYRLRRVEELLDGRLNDSDWTLRIQLALRLRRIGSS